MSRWLNDLSLRPKLSLIIGGLAAGGVLAISTLYSVMEVRAALRGARVRVVAEASAASYASAVALDAYDHALVTRTIDVLRSDPAVRSAAIHDRAGRLIGVVGAPYAPPGARSAGVAMLGRLTSSSFDFDVPTTEVSGAKLHIEMNSEQEIAAALRNCLLFMGGCSAISAVLVAACLTLLARTLRWPMASLVDTMRGISAEADYGRRLEKRGNDEFGQLQDEINVLLGEREGSDRNLRAYKKEFDRRVRERTLQLDVAVAEAREAAKRAEGASRAKSDFLARMSHEIRTPLNGVMGMAELLKHSATLDELHRRYAVVIHQSGKGLLQLINDILDFSKIEAGKLELETGRFCVREMVEDALEILAERAQSKGLELICDIPSNLDTTVYADCLRLRQIIINLVSNAVKFTERGEICVKVRAGAGIETATFTFEVSDTGIGIRAENCATIFESFVQEDTSTSRRYGGTGLGLAICKQLVELMSGTIGVNSTVGAGSTFRFSVPLAVDRSAPHEKSSAVLATARVLIVDKSAAASAMLAQHLRSWGAIATEVATAAEALTRLNSGFEGEFDVMILDAGLPQTTPTEMVAAVHKIPAFADMPVLMLHAGPEAAPPESKAMQGPLAWQSKPVRRAQFKRALEALVADIRDAWRPQQSKKVKDEAEAVRSKRRSRVKRVLLVEDNPVNQEVARAMLQTLSVGVESAASGKQALEKLATAAYDAILMDCQMPDMDGYETTQRYREWELLEGRARTPIVALTANALSGDEEKCLAAGMDYYLSKPFTIEQLHGVLEECAPPESAAYARKVDFAAAAGHAQEAVHAEEVKREATLLDGKTIERIRTLDQGGRGDLFARLAELYVASSGALVDTLNVAARTADTAAIAQAAHALKSSSANIGALPLAASCSELELAARGGKTELLDGLVERLLREHHDVLQELEHKHLAA